jgi:uncharacterized lipoprotein YmbA
MKYTVFSMTAVMILLAGCSSKSNFYQLHTPQPYGSTKHTTHLKESVIGIDEVKLADYLDKPQIVTRLSAGQLQLHEEERWVGALDKNIQSNLTRNLSRSLPRYTFLASPWDEPVEDRYRIYVAVEHFDGDVNGTVTLDARWSLVDKEENRLVTGEKVHYVEQGAPTIDGIVTTQSRMIDRLSRQIAKKIRGRLQ